VHGVVVIDKPAGPTSHDMVDRVRRTLGLRRVGHTGTLDPFATGVLPICVGKATRLARFLGAGEKTYRATVRLGFATSTDDLTGAPLGEPQPVSVDEITLRQALERLEGSYDQVSPAFSARRVGGRRLYELARRGEAGPRPARPVTIRRITLVRLAGDEVEIEVLCSPGTYVRALARDLGEALGTGAHLSILRRTRSGSFGLDRAVSGDDMSDVRGQVIPLDELLPELPAVHVGEEGRRRVQHGRDLDAKSIEKGFPEGPVEWMRVLDASGALVALAVCRPGRSEGPAPGVEPMLHPEIVLIP
jgi:tRNA pseudouridine55 synthase